MLLIITITLFITVCAAMVCVRLTRNINSARWGGNSEGLARDMLDCLEICDVDVYAHPQVDNVHYNHLQRTIHINTHTPGAIIAHEIGHILQPRILHHIRVFVAGVMPYASLITPLLALWSVGFAMGYLIATGIIILGNLSLVLWAEWDAWKFAKQCGITQKKGREAETRLMLQAIWSYAVLPILYTATFVGYGAILMAGLSAWELLISYYLYGLISVFPYVYERVRFDCPPFATAQPEGKVADWN